MSFLLLEQEGIVHYKVQRDNSNENTEKTQTQEMLIFPGFSLCSRFLRTPQKRVKN